ncbi:hypothetical protein [Tengunoibacter tsumagoiensis]|nr:hypothetical protein [Tengunoibacter tsumagoiensis]
MSWDELKQRDFIALNKRLEQVMFLRLLVLLLPYANGFVVGFVIIYEALVLPVALSVYITPVTIIIMLVGAMVVYFILKRRDVNAILQPSFHAWFTQYGMEATATVIGREASKDEDGDLIYWLEFAWSHPDTQQRSTKRISTTTVTDYNACPLESTHPVLFDPVHPNICQFYRSQLKATEIIVGYLE